MGELDGNSEYQVTCSKYIGKHIEDEGRLFIEGWRIKEQNGEELNVESVQKILANYEGKKFDVIELAASMENNTALIDKDIFNLLVRYIKDDEDDPTKKSGRIDYNFGSEGNWDANWGFERPNEIEGDVDATATMEVKGGKPTFSVADVNALQGCAEKVNLGFWSGSDRSVYREMAEAIGKNSKKFDVYSDGAETAIEEFSAEWTINDAECLFWMGNVGKHLESGVSYSVANTIIITIDKGDGTAPETKTVKVGDTLTIADIPNPTREGYTFLGWKDGDGNTIDLSAGYAPTKTTTITAQWKKDDTNDDDGDNSGLVVALADPSKVSYEYTGSAIKPAVSVKNNGKALTEGVDYTVKYSNNVKVGEKTAKITITGKNSFTSSKVIEFSITKKDLNSYDVEKGAIVVVKNSKAVPVLVYNGMKLGAKDYEFVNPDDAKKKFTSDGDKIKIRGKGNYSGEIELDVRVVEPRDLKKFTVEVGKEVLTYNGQSQTPKITVSDKVSKQTLNQTDYIIVPCGDQTSAGTQKFTVVGKGLYSGTITKSYKIKPLAVTNPSDFTVGGVEASYPFVNGGVTVNKLTVSYKGTPLILGKDYKVTYSNNKKVSGKTQAKYKIAFLGNYKGSKPVSSTFNITPASLDDNTKGLMIEIADKIYKKPGQYKSTVYVSINGVALKGSDYKAEYYIDPGRTKPMDSKNNKVTVAEGTDSAIVYVKITGKGNYASNTNTFATAEYKVWKADGKTDLSKARVTVVDKDGSKQAYTGRKVEPVVKVEVKEGRNWEIVPPDQYKVAYVNNVNKGKATVVVTGTGTKYVSSKTATFSIVAKKMNE